MSPKINPALTPVSDSGWKGVQAQVPAREKSIFPSSGTELHLLLNFLCLSSHPKNQSNIKLHFCQENGKVRLKLQELSLTINLLQQLILYLRQQIRLRKCMSSQPGCLKCLIHSLKCKVPWIKKCKQKNTKESKSGIS